MKTRRKTITSEFDGRTVSVTVAEATILISMRREQLRQEAFRCVEEDPLRGVLRQYHAELVAPVVEAEGFDTWPGPFEDFLELPERFARAWDDAVYDLNPHWAPKTVEQEAREAEDNPK